MARGSDAHTLAQARAILNDGSRMYLCHELLLVEDHGREDRFSRELVVDLHLALELPDRAAPLDCCHMDIHAVAGHHRPAEARLVAGPEITQRPEERRGEEECVRKCRSRWSPDPYKKKKK